MEELEKSTDSKGGAGETLKLSSTASLQCKKPRISSTTGIAQSAKGNSQPFKTLSLSPWKVSHSHLAFPVSSLRSSFLSPFKPQIQLIAEFILEARSLDPFPKIFLLHHPSNSDFLGSQSISLSRSLSQFSSLLCVSTVISPTPICLLHLSQHLKQCLAHTRCSKIIVK